MELARLVELLERELESLVDRLRGWTPARWRAAAPPIGSRGDAAHHLADWLAAAGQRVEEADRDEPPAERRLPRLEADLVLPDQVAVAGHDLLAALPAAPVEIWSCAGRVPVQQVAAEALAEVLLHRRDLDGSAPPSASAAAALAVLSPTAPPTPAQLLLTAAGRCPAYRRRPAG